MDKRRRKALLSRGPVAASRVRLSGRPPETYGESLRFAKATYIRRSIRWDPKLEPESPMPTFSVGWSQPILFISPAVMAYLDSLDEFHPEEPGIVHMSQVHDPTNFEPFAGPVELEEFLTQREEV